MTIADCSNEDGSPRQGMKEKWQEIQNQIRFIFDAAAEWCICYGEAQKIVLSQFGKKICNIDENNFENIRLWFKNNGFRSFQILSPQQHNKLIQSENEYSAWFNKYNKRQNITYNQYAQ